MKYPATGILTGAALVYSVLKFGLIPAAFAALLCLAIAGAMRGDG